MQCWCLPYWSLFLAEYSGGTSVSGPPTIGLTWLEERIPVGKTSSRPSHPLHLNSNVPVTGVIAGRAMEEMECFRDHSLLSSEFWLIVWLITWVGVVTLSGCERRTLISGSLMTSANAAANSGSVFSDKVGGTEMRDCIETCSRYNSWKNSRTRCEAWAQYLRDMLVDKSKHTKQLHNAQ